MTLNITIVTEKSIYQSADYRLTDLTTGRTYDDARNQKIFVAVGNSWLATVCFNGVGRTATMEVSDWLSRICDATRRDESLGELLARLQTADAWLATASPRDRRLSFIVAAFAGRVPIVSLVSNYERFDGRPAATAESRLSIHQLRPHRSKTLVSGQPQDISRPRRRALAALAAEATESGKIFEALARVNREVAASNEAVSSSCFTTCVRRTGDGEGRPHEMDISAGLERVTPLMSVVSLLKSQPEGIHLQGQTLKQYVFAHAWSTDEYHAIQLEDRPERAATHLNYGAYLLDRKGDVYGAERAFLKALTIDSAYTHALGNLANIRARQERIEEADDLYRQALKSSPGDESIFYNYGDFLLRKRRPSAQIRAIVEDGIGANPSSGRLQALLGDIELREGRPKHALEAFRRARELGAEQAAVESGYAIALQLARAPINDCISAYRTAIALNPTCGVLHLNMAQLLFAAGLDDQARRMLQAAYRLDLDPSAQLEAHFYAIAHATVDPEAITSTIRGLLETGARVTWSFDVNIETVRARDPNRADLLRYLHEVMAGNAPVTELAGLLNQVIK